MKRRFSAAEKLDILLESSGEEGDQTNCDLESAEDQGSETDSQTEFDADYVDTDEDSEVEDPGVATYASKNGEIVWTATAPDQTPGRAAAENIMKMTPGPTRYACSRVQDARSAFELFLPEKIQKKLIDMTNLEGKRVFEESWNEVDWVDLQAYIGLLLLAGVYRSHNEATMSLWNAETGRAIFCATMSLRAFEVMTRVIRFEDRETRPYRWRNYKLAAIREVWDKWVEILPKMYNPGQAVTVDECLVPFRGRSDGQREKNLAMRVVLDMSVGLQGHTITCDNYFTSYALGQELLKRKLGMLGTVRKNKPELPSALKNRNVLLMSTVHKGATVSTGDERKPDVILDYNKTKGGVDSLDQMVAAYTCKRTGGQWLYFPPCSMCQLSTPSSCGPK
ncbi:hypothetical protein F2P79_003453 [Pimephales promelas]|nr:hypothetical protein F2P79_003453 [Pimephales promelas]